MAWPLGSLSATIAADNTVLGLLSLPASITGSAATANMAGTVVQSGATVRFQQTVDTFIRDLTFAVVGNTLTGDKSGGGIRVVHRHAVPLIARVRDQWPATSGR